MAHKVSDDTIEYFKSLSLRVTNYFNALKRTKRFLNEHQIRDEHTVLTCAIMSLLWVAAVREEQLSEEEIFSFLQVDPVPTKLGEAYSITPAMAEWSLEEILTYIINRY